MDLVLRMKECGFKDISQDFELEELDWMIVPFKETEDAKRGMLGGKVGYSLIQFMCSKLRHPSVHLTILLKFSTFFCLT